MADFSFDQNIGGSLLSDVEAKVTLGGLDDINVDTTVGGRLDSAVTSTSTATTTSALDLTSDSKLELAPVTTTSSMDLKPVAVDTCVRIELGSVPPTEVHTPWEQKLGLSVLGVELFSWVLAGRSTTTLRPAQTRPLVIGGEHSRRQDCGCADHDEHDEPDDPAAHGAAADSAPGLHLRLG